MARAAAWLCSITGVLLVVVGLRDIFAPGFLAMSTRAPSQLEIIFELAVAATFFVAAGIFSRRRRPRGRNKQVS